MRTGNRWQKEIGFLVELGDGEPMTQLPDGCNAYFIPEKD